MAKDQTTTIGRWRVNMSPIAEVPKTAVHVARASRAAQALEAFRTSAEEMRRSVLACSARQSPAFVAMMLVVLLSFAGGQPRNKPA
jgi:hypothetical protein